MSTQLPPEEETTPTQPAPTGDEPRNPDPDAPLVEEPAPENGP